MQDTLTKAQDEKNLVALGKKIGKGVVEGGLKRVSRGLQKFRFVERAVEKVCLLNCALALDEPMLTDGQVKKDEKVPRGMEVVPTIWHWGRIPGSERMAEW